jgi:TRAP-type mannitol/chloroaromatic compound transport system permease large subunit
MMKKIFFVFLHLFSNKFFLVSILVTLLSGARHQRNQSLSEKIVKRMEKLFPEAEKGLISASILLSNVYATSGQLDEATKIRMKLIESGKKKEIGQVWTEFNGKILVKTKIRFLSK